jgi:hypothetical protein
VIKQALPLKLEQTSATDWNDRRVAHRIKGEMNSGTHDRLAYGTGTSSRAPFRGCVSFMFLLNLFFHLWHYRQSSCLCIAPDNYLKMFASSLN